MIETEIAIVGAGPAGLAAACEAAQVGSKVVVFDENNQPGGQLVKQIHKFFGSKEHMAGTRGIDIGNKLYKLGKAYSSAPGSVIPLYPIYLRYHIYTGTYYYDTYT